MSHGRGTVWWGPAPNKAGPAYRPWVIVSNSSHPFSGEECIALAMTTTRHRDGIEVPAGAWVEGGSNVDSYVSPWYVATIKLGDLDRQQGTLDEAVLTDAIEALHRYTPPATD